MRPIEIELCVGTACHLMGGNELMELVQNLPETKKGWVQLKLTHCLNACNKGPNARIDGILYSQLTEETLQRLITMHLQERGRL